MIGTYAAYFVKQAGAYLRYTQNCTSGLTVAGRLCCSQRALAPATMLDSSRNVSVASAEAFSPQALQVGSIERRPRSQQRVAACLRTSRRRGSSSRAHFCAPPKNDWATRGTGGRAEIHFPSRLLPRLLPSNCPPPSSSIVMGAPHVSVVAGRWCRLASWSTTRALGVRRKSVGLGVQCGTIH